MNENKKSPLTAKPLRYAGQSLDEEINDLFDDKILKYAIFCLLVVYFIVNEWVRYKFPNHSSPWVMTFIGSLFILFSIYKIYKACRKVKCLKLGRDGERAVGQYLELMKDKHSRVFHDLLGETFNLDHVFVSAKGIYVIETKTRSKPIRGQAVIEYNGKELKIDRRFRDDKPIIQVKDASKWLENLLQESTGKKFKIKPVVLFPGWYIENVGEGNNEEVWVINPKALPSFIDKQPDIISCEDVMLISFHLSRFIRSKA